MHACKHFFFSCSLFQLGNGAEAQRTAGCSRRKEACFSHIVSHSLLWILCGSLSYGKLRWIEHIWLLYFSRREIEELEVTFQEREAVRLSEQQTKEKQLEEKKRKLESMLDETEKVKKEAEEVKIQIPSLCNGFGLI